MPNSAAKMPASVRQNYLLRITSYGVIFLVYLSLFWGQGKDPLFWLAVALNGLVYPHLAFKWVKSNSAEHRMLLWDAASYGVHLAIWGFNPYLISLFCAAISVTYLSVGGTHFWLRACAALALGLGLGGLGNGWSLRAELPLPALLIVSTGFILYMLNLGYLIFRINKNLRRARQDVLAQQLDLVVMNRLAQAANQSIDMDTIMEAIMEALVPRYAFEVLYILPQSRDKSGFVIDGIYGNCISTAQRRLFMKMIFNLEADKDSIFVKGVVKNTVIYLPKVSQADLVSAAAIDRQLYAIKPSKSLVYFPISVDNQVVAGACFLNYSEYFHLEPDDIKRISEYLVHAGSALRNLHLFQELTSAKNSAEQARHLAQESEAAKGRFLANMSHEIRTPLTAVLGYAEALLEKNLQESEREQFVKIILRSGQHLLAMINDILDIAKIEAGKITLEYLPISLVPFIYHLQTLTEFKAKEKELEFHLKIEYPLPYSIQSDVTRLNQILFNLLNNALKFTLVGSISLEVAYRENTLILAVSDTGVGIDTTQTFAVFSAFTQADTSTTRLFGGTGLGLFISQNLAQVMGGKIFLTSARGEGSRFEVRLPVQACNGWIENQNQFDELWQTNANTQQEIRLPQLRGRVLVAEDNPENQQLISRILEQLGLQFDIVHNGAQALVKALQETYDLLLFDLQMPLMGGKEAAEILIRRGIQTPIIAFTANLMSNQTAEYLAIGFAGIVEKPFNKLKIAQELARHLHSAPAIEKILLVDDESVNQMVVSQLLKAIQPSLEITLASDGDQAMRLAAERQFDLILMDKQMPLLDGLEATQRIRAQGNKIPIYILSAHTSAELMPQALAAGADGCLEKPVRKADFIQLLKGHSAANQHGQAH